MANRGPQGLVLRAEAELNQVTSGSGTDEVFLHAHMAALRAAAAVVQVQGPVIGGRGRRVRSVWEQLGEVSADWQVWARYFAGQANVRSAIESGRNPGVTVAEAGAALDAATDFLAAARAAVTADRAPSRLAS